MLSTAYLAVRLCGAGLVAIAAHRAGGVAPAFQTLVVELVIAHLRPGSRSVQRHHVHPGVLCFVACVWSPSPSNAALSKPQSLQLPDSQLRHELGWMSAS